MREARAYLGVAVVNNKIYAIGGDTDAGPTLSTNEEYDPATDTWTFKAPMPTSRMSFGIAVYENKIYCIGGYGGVRANEAYDPATDTWESKAPLPTASGPSTASTLYGKIYVIGSGSNATVQVYDPSADSWTTKAPMPAAPGSAYIWAWSCTSAVLDGKIHVIGVTPFSNSHQIYDSATNIWSFGVPPISGYFLAAAGVTTGSFAPKRIYVFGTDRVYWGLNLPEITGQSYDPVTDNWTNCAPMLTGRINVADATVNDELYVIGGETPFIGENTIKSAKNEKYTPFEYGTISSASPTPSIPEMPSSALILGLVAAFSIIIVAVRKKIACTNSKSCPCSD